jgi:hypothetical protein
MTRMKGTYPDFRFASLVIINGRTLSRSACSVLCVACSERSMTIRPLESPSREFVVCYTLFPYVSMNRAGLYGTSGQTHSDRCLADYLLVDQRYHTFVDFGLGELGRFDDVVDYVSVGCEPHVLPIRIR